MTEQPNEGSPRTDDASNQAATNGQMVDDDMGIPRPIGEPSVDGDERPAGSAVPTGQRGDEDTVDRPVDPARK
jgi:hypothetical protein